MKSLLKKWIGRRIHSGPFRGMRYADQSAGSTFLPKLLGIYEKEIAEDVVSLIQSSTQTIVDVGCAEGYYANGALVLNPRVNVIAYDIDPKARELCQLIAKKNGNSDRIQIRECCDKQKLKNVLEDFSVDFLIVDVEGYEIQLLDPETIPALRSINIVVELHDNEWGQVNYTFKQRFHLSHQIKHVLARYPSWQDIDIPIFRALARINKHLETMCVWERPSQANLSWFIMTPIKG